MGFPQSLKVLSLKSEKPKFVIFIVFAKMASSFKEKMSASDSDGKSDAILTSAAKSTNSREYRKLIKACVNGYRLLSNKYR